MNKFSWLFWCFSPLYLYISVFLLSFLTCHIMDFFAYSTKYWNFFFLFLRFLLTPLFNLHILLLFIHLIIVILLCSPPYSNSAKASDWVSLYLSENNIPCVNLNGNMTAALREGRFEAFQSGQALGLSCTDLTSRGLDTVRVGIVFMFWKYFLSCVIIKWVFLGDGILLLLKWVSLVLD